MLTKRHTALSPHWAAARHARSTGQTDGSTPELERAPAQLGDLAAGPAEHADVPVLERLAASAREGDRCALQELASLLQPSVWRFAYHLSGNEKLVDNPSDTVAEAPASRSRPRRARGSAAEAVPE